MSSYLSDRLSRWVSSKESTCQAEDSGSIPGSGGSPGEGDGNPLQYSCLGNPMDRGAWRATVHGVARVRHDLDTKQQYLSDKSLLNIIIPRINLHVCEYLISTFLCTFSCEHRAWCFVNVVCDNLICFLELKLFFFSSDPSTVARLLTTSSITTIPCTYILSQTKQHDDDDGYDNDDDNDNVTIPFSLDLICKGSTVSEKVFMTQDLWNILSL